MDAERPAIVDVVRDFFSAHRLARLVLARHAEGRLRFSELETLVGEDERSALFRLKERCHILFRSSAWGEPAHREALFDLAVGSLFHEAMRLRENCYQREVYAPRVRVLKREAGPESGALFDEFEKITEGVARRIDEGVQESGILLDQTAAQLRVLLAEHRDEAVVTRFLVEQAAAASEIFDMGFDALLAEIYGSAAEGYTVAGRSYLRSGFYAPALRAFECADAQGGDSKERAYLAAYARGMAAYEARDYEESVAQLGAWAARREGGDDHLVRLARDAVSRVGQLAEGEERERLTRAGAALLERLPEPPRADGALP